MSASFLARASLALFVFACSTTLFASTTHAQRGLSFAVGGGISADPDGGVITFDAPFGVTDRVSVGPLVHIVLDGDLTITAATAHLRIGVGSIGPIRPFLSGGLGVAHSSLDVGSRDLEDTSFMLNVGLGAELPLAGAYSLRTSGLVNVVPDGVPGDEFFFTWEILALKYTF